MEADRAKLLSDIEIGEWIVNYDEAMRHLRRALLADPDDARIHYLLGNILREKEEYDAAAVHYRESLRIDPQFAEAYNNLGLTLQQEGRLDEAIDCYLKTLELNPSLTGIYYNLGTVFQDKRDFEKAERYYLEAVARNPDDADAHYNLANVLRESKKIDDALSHYQAALTLNPSFADAYNNMGSILSERRLFSDAVACFHKALRIDPNLSGVYNNLGLVFKEQGQFDKAIEYFETALRMTPSFIEVLNNVAGILFDQGRVTEAETILKKAIQISPLPVTYSSLLFAMHYNPSHSPQDVLAESVNFSKLFADSTIPGIFSHARDCAAGRRLRIGYVSPDFRRHSVAHFIEPVLSFHNREGYEIFCYSDVLHPDEVTRRMEGHAEQWRSITGIPDEEAAGLIRADRIDILVDLAGHTERNRMLVFARKPAPVQVSWIGYPATTGLQAMDYKIVDGYTDPSGLTEQFYTERLIRLPETFLCYRPVEDSPEIGESPCLTSGHITFGSFNNYPKVSSEVLLLWIKILKGVTGSRLVLKARSFVDKGVREALTGRFVGEGIEGGRIELLPWQSLRREHLDLYNRIDIALDTFPYNGATTTCEALWMGVPVIAIAGGSHASRVGMSILSNIGLPDFVAEDEEGYVRKAVNLAHDTARLLKLRKSLRDMMLSSPLMDARLFTANLESSYKWMWNTWCENEHK
jgi:protein O-GlcNAc transferase